MNCVLRAHWNRHKKMWSLKDGAGPTRHVSEAYMRDCTFVVQPGWRARCLLTGVRNVHAYVRGEPCRQPWPRTWPWASVHYDPFQSPDFLIGGKPVRHANHVWLAPGGGCYAR